MFRTGDLLDGMLTMAAAADELCPRVRTPGLEPLLTLNRVQTPSSVSLFTFSLKVIHRKQRCEISVLL